MKSLELTSTMLLFIAVCFVRPLPILAQPSTRPADVPQGMSQEVAKATQPQVYVSTKGYSIQVPKDWRVADAAINEVLKDETSELFPKLKSVDFNQVDSFLFDPHIDAFCESINVVVTPKTIPVTESQRDEFSQFIQNQYKTMGLTTKEFTSRIQQYADRDCYVYDYNFTLEGINIHQTQYMVPGHDVTYIATCSVAVEDFDQYQPIFEAAMQTFKLTGTGPNFWERLPQPVQWGIIGGGIGIIFSLISSLFRKSSNKPQTDLTESD